MRLRLGTSADSRVLRRRSRRCGIGFVLLAKRLLSVLSHRGETESQDRRNFNGEQRAGIAIQPDRSGRVRVADHDRDQGENRDDEHASRNSSQTK